MDNKKNLCISFLCFCRARIFVCFFRQYSVSLQYGLKWLHVSEIKWMIMNTVLAIERNFMLALFVCVCDNSVRRFKRRTVNEKDNLYLEFFSFSCQSVNCTSKRFAIRTELNRTLKALRFDRTPLCIRFNRAVLFRNSKWAWCKCKR